MCVYKMFKITKETLENNGIGVIVDSVNALWLNEKNIVETLRYNFTSYLKQIQQNIQKTQI